MIKIFYEETTCITVSVIKTLCLSCYSSIAAAAYDKTLRTWDLETGKLLVSMPCPVEVLVRGVSPGLREPWGGKRSQSSSKREFSQGPKMMEHGLRGRRARRSRQEQAGAGLCLKDGYQWGGGGDNGSWHFRLRERDPPL